jgi:hypothetical protein
VSNAAPVSADKSRTTTTRPPRKTTILKSLSRALPIDMRCKIRRFKPVELQIDTSWTNPVLDPFPSIMKLHRLEENVGAAVVELPAHNLRDIDRAISQVTVQGARYPEHLEQMTGR